MAMGDRTPRRPPARKCGRGRGAPMLGAVAAGGVRGGQGSPPRLALDVSLSRVCACVCVPACP